MKSSTVNPRRVGFLLITTINGWGRWLKWLQISHNYLHSFTFYLSVNLEFQYFLLHTLSFFLQEPQSQCPIFPTIILTVSHRSVLLLTFLNFYRYIDVVQELGLIDEALCNLTNLINQEHNLISRVVRKCRISLHFALTFISDDRLIGCKLKMQRYESDKNFKITLADCLNTWATCYCHIDTSTSYLLLFLLSHHYVY